MHFVQLCIILYLYAQYTGKPVPLRTSPACFWKNGGQKGATNTMDIAVGDTILTRKKHPCGASSFEVLRVGMDFKIRCTGCGREVMLPRAKIEKNIKKVVKPGQE